MKDERVVSFRGQRVGWTFAIFTVVFAFTSAVLWNHVEGFMESGVYQYMAKAGLLLLPLVTLMMTVYELFADDTSVKRKHKSHPKVIRFVNFCFWGSTVLAICEVVHAGAVLKYESSVKEQQSNLTLLGDTQAKIAGAATSAAIESSGKVAKDLNAVGQRRSAQRVLRAGETTAATVTTSGQKAVQEAAAGIQGETFLPDWYIKGGMYAALSVLALVAFALTMAFARAAQPHIDKDDDGVPDNQKESQPTPSNFNQNGFGAGAIPATGKTTVSTGNFYNPSAPK